MRRLLRCRRGSITFGVVVALVPLIGALALGGEAASWYVTKQHAQNAADAAAYSGALVLACSGSSGGSCTPSQSAVQYSGYEFAAQNGYCNSGSMSYPGSLCTAPTGGVSQSVAIATGTYASGTFTPSATGGGNAVQAIVQQTQPAYLASVLGFTTINIGAQAVARVEQLLDQPCVLALGGSISFQDSAVTVNAPGCGLASNATPPTAGINFQANPTINAGSISTSSGCSGSSSYCSSVLTYLPPVVDPYSALNTAMTSLTLPNCSGSGLTPYTAATPCANNNFSTNTTTTISTSGVYFFSGTVKLIGSGSITTGAGIQATIILLPGATLSMAGTTSITITAQTTVPTSELPAQLQSDASLLSDMAIYDIESGIPKINGGASITANGVLYFPNATLDFQGNQTASQTGCAELIAFAIQFQGTASFNNTTCPVIPPSKIVALVQ